MLKHNNANSINEVFNDFSIDKKKSLVNLHFLIATCDPNEYNAPGAIKYLNFLVDSLGLSSKACNDYLERYGDKKTVHDLLNIKLNQQEFLVLSILNIIDADKNPTQIKVYVATRFFDELKINKQQLQNAMGFLYRFKF